MHVLEETQQTVASVVEMPVVVLFGIMGYQKGHGTTRMEWRLTDQYYVLFALRLKGLSQIGFFEIVA